MKKNAIHSASPGQNNHLLLNLKFDSLSALALHLRQKGDQTQCLHTLQELVQQCRDSRDRVSQTKALSLQLQSVWHFKKIRKANLICCRLINLLRKRIQKQGQSQDLLIQLVLTIVSLASTYQFMDDLRLSLINLRKALQICQDQGLTQQRTLVLEKIAEMSLRQQKRQGVESFRTSGEFKRKQKIKNSSTSPSRNNFSLRKYQEVQQTYSTTRRTLTKRCRRSLQLLNSPTLTSKQSQPTLLVQRYLKGWLQMKAYRRTAQQVKYFCYKFGGQTVHQYLNFEKDGLLLLRVGSKIIKKALLPHLKRKELASVFHRQYLLCLKEGTVIWLKEFISSHRAQLTKIYRLFKSKAAKNKAALLSRRIDIKVLFTRFVRKDSKDLIQSALKVGKFYYVVLQNRFVERPRYFIRKAVTKQDIYSPLIDQTKVKHKRIPTSRNKLLRQTFVKARNSLVSLIINEDGQPKLKVEEVESRNQIERNLRGSEFFRLLQEQKFFNRLNFNFQENRLEIEAQSQPSTKKCSRRLQLQSTANVVIGEHFNPVQTVCQLKESPQYHLLEITPVTVWVRGCLVRILAQLWQLSQHYQIRIKGVDQTQSKYQLIAVKRVHNSQAELLQSDFVSTIVQRMDIVRGRIVFYDQ